MASQAPYDDYFASYSDLSIHQLMLKDRPRTLAYRTFFETHRDLVQGKTVMDVGAGTGILSLFAASAGAKTVYAVEASDTALLCEEIVKENGFESIIKVIHGAVEDITIPEVDNVDVIVSEWMGFHLLHESMLDSVIIARDRFLASSGILVPSHASLYMAPVDMTDHFQDRADEWSNVYGYDFSPIASCINAQEVSRPLIQCIDPCVVKSDAELVLTLNLKTVTIDDIKSFSTFLKFPIKEESKIHGFAVWFCVDFALDNREINYADNSKEANVSTLKQNALEHNMVMSEKASVLKDKGSASKMHAAGDASIEVKDSADDTKENRSTKQEHTSDDHQLKDTVFSFPGVGNSNSIQLSTGPHSPPTHWKQTVVFLPQTIMVEAGIDLCCKTSMFQDSANHRHYNISIELKDKDDDNEDGCDDNEAEEGSVASGEESDDSNDHPVPCSCDSARCRLISALVEKYDVEHQELEGEAEMVETAAEVDAANEIDAEIETCGWTMDSSGSALADDVSGSDA